MNVSHPVQLLVGSLAVVRQAAEELLQKSVCQSGGCKVCVQCRMIADRRHFQLCWLVPEGHLYTRAELDSVLERSTMLLDPDEQFFTVIEAAELLSTATATMLLKLLEEPLPGHIFLLLTEQRDLVLPTIVSRSVERSYAGVLPYERKDIIELLLRPTWSSIASSLKKIEQAGLLEQGTRGLLDELLRVLMQQDAPWTEVLEVMQAYDTLPLPGAGKLFWRNFLIQRVITHENANITPRSAVARPRS